MKISTDVWQCVAVCGVLAVFLCGFLVGRDSPAQEHSAEKETGFLITDAMEEAHGITASEEEGKPLESGEAMVQSDGETGDWRLILVNADHPLPETYQIPQITRLRNGNAIDSRAYPALQAMMDAARAEGLKPLICSSYRSMQKQTALFDNKTAEYEAQGYAREAAEELASYWVARPGTSEHQLGLAVDIVDADYQVLDEAQERTAVQQWLIAHCAEYGFILRYPTAKSSITGIGYEPWHYRYVGTEAAAAIMEQGICLEEYLASF